MGGGQVGGGGGGQGECELRSEAFVTIRKKNIFYGRGGLGGGRVGGGQGGCEWRSEAFVKIQKNIFFFGGGAGASVGEVGLGWSGWMGTEK